MQSTRLKTMLMIMVFALLLAACVPPAEAPTQTTASQATEATTLPPVETTIATEPVTVFPDEPEKNAVQALPETYDISTLVFPYWEQGIKFSNDHTYYISIPAIYPFSEAAVACQQEIYDLFSTRLASPVELLSLKYEGMIERFDMSGEGSGAFYDASLSDYFGYSAGYRNDVLSVLVRLDEEETNRSHYYSFYLDLTSGKRLKAEDAYVKYDVDKADIADALEAYFNEMHSGVDKSLDFYQENLKKTLSDENIAACRLCCSENGSVMMVANIYTAGSVEQVERVIILQE